jgi:hypothetical protein
LEELDGIRFEKEYGRMIKDNIKKEEKEGLEKNSNQWAVIRDNLKELNYLNCG